MGGRLVFDPPVAVNELTRIAAMWIVMAGCFRRGNAPVAREDKGYKDE
jgi:hypothetical protein